MSSSYYYIKSCTSLTMLGKRLLFVEFICKVRKKAKGVLMLYECIKGKKIITSTVSI